MLQETLDELVIDSAEYEVKSTLLVDLNAGRLPNEENTIWFINSTKEGGGVAEMIPHIVKELGTHGYTLTWAILSTEETRFFEITKEIHNMIHDHGKLEPFTDRDRKIFERVASNAADVLVPLLKPGDIVLIHDP